MTLTLRAVLAALALIVPVSAELIWPAVGDSGHVFFAAAQLVGWFLVATVVRDGASRHRRRARPALAAWAAACFFRGVPCRFCSPWSTAARP